VTRPACGRPVGYIAIVPSPQLVDPRGGAVYPVCDRHDAVAPEDKAGKPRQIGSVDGAGLNAMTGGPSALALRNSVRIC